MARLVINPGSPTAWEVHLKAGVNSLGRGFANDFKLDDPSVSGAHCQIVVDQDNVIIRDLGSTNGTYVNRAPVRETALQPGQTIHLGGVEMLFRSDTPAYLTVNEAESVPPPIPVPPIAPLLAVPATAAGSQNCRFHHKTPGRFFCNKCQKFFCELCVTSRPMAGVRHAYCRHCGAECAPVQVRLQRAVQAGFVARLPGAFAYPIRGAGALVIIVGIVVLALLQFGQMMMGFGSIRFLIFGLILQVCAGGYLFTYLQSIVHSTTAEDREMPDLPGMSNFLEDILLPFFRLLGLVLFCFGPAIGLAIWVAASGQSAAGPAVIAAAVFGGLYFPMAFLAVAILDSVAAANPLVIVPSIVKVPLEYLLTLCLLAAVIAFRALGDFLVRVLFPKGFTTHSMGELFAMLSAQAFWGFTSFYLLVVAVHILGLLYVTKKNKLGWLDR